MEKKKGLNRREFLSTATKASVGAGIGITVLPSHVMGGSGRVAPSDRIKIYLQKKEQKRPPSEEPIMFLENGIPLILHYVATG